MNDPHVVALHYTAKSECDRVQYQDPPPHKFETELAHFSLTEGTLIVRPRGHYASADEARKTLESYIRAWEANSDIDMPTGTIRFHYQHADIVDRNPSPQNNGGTTLNVHDSHQLIISDSVRITVTLSHYPAPPGPFNADSEIVQDLMRRFRKWKDGRQELEHIAYYCATLLRHDSRWRISDKVFGTLQRLSSEKGGADSARKAGALLLTEPERQWIEKAIPAIIRQVAAIEDGAAPELLTMDKLPTL